MASDLVFALDQKQSTPEGTICPRNRAHGRLGVHVSGSMLICGDKKCEHVEPVGDPRNL